VQPTKLATLAGLLLLVGQTILPISDRHGKPGALRPVNGFVVSGGRQRASWPQSCSRSCRGRKRREEAPKMRKSPTPKCRAFWTLSPDRATRTQSGKAATEGPAGRKLRR
jgi:hypothetical protein